MNTDYHRFKKNFYHEDKVLRSVKSKPKGKATAKALFTMKDMKRLKEKP